MKYALMISGALLLALGQPQAASAQKGSLVDQAIAAQGGADALRGLKGLAIKGEAKFWEPGQSEAAGGEPRFLEDAKFSILWDLAKGSARTEWDRDHKYPDPVGKISFTENVTPNLGWVTSAQAPQGMSGVRLATHLRELKRSSPALLLAALDNPGGLAPAGKQKLGKQSLPAVTLVANNTTFTVLFDPKTHLPAAIRTVDDDNVHGDSNFDLVLGDWKAVGGAQVAHALSYRIGGIEVAKLTYTSVTANPAIAADAFNIPDAAKATAKAPATSGNIPYQWVFRRLGMSRLVDNDQPFLPPGGSFKLVEIAPNVQHMQGGGANNLIVNMKDFLVVFDSPYGIEQSKMAIALAKAKYPGKPIKYLIQTHHHMDHSGGMRAYVEEGATIVVAAPTAAYFKDALKAPRSVANGGTAKKAAPVKIEEVKDEKVIKDGDNEIRIHNIPNPHAKGYLLGHVVKENVVFVTDLISPRGQIDKTEGTVAVGNAFRKYGITGATIAGGHGAIAKQADITAALAP
jgi:glyoxylase-like metal-dependent hydrolase (beta-lactamase superfamily II)